MFNANDDNDKLFNKEKQEIKDAPKKTDLYDFSDFNTEQNGKVEEKKTVTPNPTGGISFHEFEEIFLTDEEMAKAKEKDKDKESLKEHFEQNRAAHKEEKLEKAVQKQKTKKTKRLKKRKQKHIEDFEDVKKRRAYKFKRKKYRKVEDFISYLNDNYLDLDDIAEKLLTDENFHGWLKKRSKRFDESIEDFKDIVEIIGN